MVVKYAILIRFVSGILINQVIGTTFSNVETVNTSVGTINGFIETTRYYNGQEKGTFKFLGIPYAVPPVGNLRFRKPRPAPRFKQPFNATKFGPGCLQNKFLMSQWLPGRDYLSEDCLTLNIFAPVHSFASKYAVMLWIHGGAYQIGQSSIYSGENLARYGHVIVVSKYIIDFFYMNSYDQL